ncbi:MAG: Nif3-like dinuclear metal center hexameric protein [Synergistaceae bacterium]|nr:Nif3-like dinuclear metal center hexameric protein [Synergistaceae bacterium]
MTVREILDRIEGFAPVSLAEDYDNVGLMVGDLDAEVRRLAVSLDTLPDVVREAGKRGCSALLTHHPLFFAPARRVDFSTLQGAAVRAAIETGVAVLAAHTNWDNAPCGVNAVLAGLLGLTDVRPLVHDGAKMTGAVGVLPSSISEVGELIKSAWGLSRLDCYGSGQAAPPVRRVALCGGSGGSLWRHAKQASADLYVTADMKYHEIMECVASGITVAVADHGEMERATMAALAERVGKGQAPRIETCVLDVRGYVRGEKL